MPGSRNKMRDGLAADQMNRFNRILRCAWNVTSPKFVSVQCLLNEHKRGETNGARRFTPDFLFPGLYVVSIKHLTTQCLPHTLMALFQFVSAHYMF